MTNYNDFSNVELVTVLRSSCQKLNAKSVEEGVTKGCRTIT